MYFDYFVHNIYAFSSFLDGIWSKDKKEKDSLETPGELSMEMDNGAQQSEMDTKVCNVVEITENEPSETRKSSSSVHTEDIVVNNIRSGANQSVKGADDDFECHNRKVPKSRASVRQRQRAQTFSSGRLQNARGHLNPDLSIVPASIEDGYPELIIRVVSDSQKRHAVSQSMLKRYKSISYPREFPYRSKCIMLFQRIHGVYTIIFVIFVYE